MNNNTNDTNKTIDAIINEVAVGFDENCNQLVSPVNGYGQNPLFELLSTIDTYQVNFLYSICIGIYLLFNLFFTLLIFYIYIFNRKRNYSLCTFKIKVRRY